MCYDLLKKAYRLHVIKFDIYHKALPCSKTNTDGSRDTENKACLNAKMRLRFEIKHNAMNDYNQSVSNT